MARPPATARAIAVARGDEPADLLIRGGRVFEPRHARVGRRRTSRSPTAWSSGGAARRARGDRRRRGRADARVRRRPHAPRVDEAVGRRVRPRRPPARDHRRRRRPARDRQRVRRRRRRRAGRGGRAAAVHVRHLAPRAACRRRRSSLGRRARRRRHPRADRRHGAHRRGRGHELPRRDRRRPRDARAHRGRRHAPGRRPQPGRARPGARRLPRGRGRVRPRVHELDGGRGEAPQGDVGVHPPGFGEPEPRRRSRPTSSATAPSCVAFCTDDREPDTLLSRGHVNDCARLAVAAGVSEIDALVLASTQPGPLPRLRAPREPRRPATRPTSSASTRSAAGSRRGCGRRGRLVAEGRADARRRRARGAASRS